MSQSYWNLKQSSIPLWKQKNDDTKIGKKEIVEKKIKKETPIRDTKLDKYYEKLSKGQGEIEEVFPLPSEPKEKKIIFKRREQPSL